MYSKVPYVRHSVRAGNRLHNSEISLFVRIFPIILRLDFVPSIRQCSFHEIHVGSYRKVFRKGNCANCGEQNSQSGKSQHFRTFNFVVFDVDATLVED